VRHPPVVAEKIKAGGYNDGGRWKLMDETEVEGKPSPRFRLFVSNAKHEAIGESVCESDNLDDLRMFRRRADTRYVLYEWRNRIPLNNLEVDPFTDIRSATDKSDGNGWHCKNPKCRMLIAAAKDLPADKTLLLITCPHCHQTEHYCYRDFGWKKAR
jgi:hypothetical protein